MAHAIPPVFGSIRSATRRMRASSISSKLIARSSISLSNRGRLLARVSAPDVRSNGEGAEMRDLWLSCMTRALEKVRAAEAVRETLMRHFTRAAEMVINLPVEGWPAPAGSVE